MNSASEQKYLRDLRRRLPADDRATYLAAISVANSGATIPEEACLPEIEKNLLQVRRFLYEQKLDEARSLLEKCNSLDPFLKGDQLFLIAQFHHRKGEQKSACIFMNEAGDLYQQAGDLHRELRARSNSAICLSSLESCLVGDLHIYEQEARREGFLDILANILRTKAMEFLIAQRPQEAQAQALEAAGLYELDGYREDHAVALTLAAVCALLIGDVVKAQELKSRSSFLDGKVKSYHQVYMDLLTGKVPKVIAGHPLERMNWKSAILKPESVAGKIVQHLRTGAKTKDELIRFTWGENALDISYCDRLYTAINSLRKERLITVIFDGEFYRLS